MIFLHYTDRNIGDQHSCPKHYFPEWQYWPSKTLYRDEVTNDNSSGLIIVGGGGILIPGAANHFRDLEKLGRPMVFWGGGMNNPEYDSSLLEGLVCFKLVGIRDFYSDMYMPCASCLHPLFSRKSDPTLDYVIVEHIDGPIPIEGERITNRAGSLFPVVDLILKGRTVITNSYHGAYWAMLLHKQVVLYEVESCRFQFFKHKPVRCEASNWKDFISGEPTAPADYLDECRTLNANFAARVRELE